MADVKPKKQEYNDIIAVHLNDWLAFLFLKLFLKTRITPNQLTALSTLIIIPIGILFSLGVFKYYLIGAILMYLMITLDHTDGKLARARKQETIFGAIFDEWSDRLKEYVIFFSLIFGQYRLSNDPTIIFIGLLATTNFFFMHYSRALVESKCKRIIREFPMMGKKYSFNFSTFTYYLIIICAVFNLIYYFLYVYAILGVFLWTKKMHKVYKHKNAINKAG